MSRYQLAAYKKITPMWHCEECHALFWIEQRIYYDTENVIDNKVQIVETSVRTTCTCIKEIDPYIEANKKKPVFTDVSKGIPKPTVTLVNKKTDKEVVPEKTHIDDILDYNQNT